MILNGKSFGDKVTFKILESKITFHFGLYGGHKGQGVPNKTEEISMRPVFFPLGYVMYADF